ncbi:uncharacterized protein [Castor canadensis]|uniref:Uncharacterized protein n=1 Tax=Castor canadensis TaxID=51338 RepID=A0AC58MFZ6_CASCN
MSAGTGPAAPAPRAAIGSRTPRRALGLLSTRLSTVTSYLSKDEAGGSGAAIGPFQPAPAGRGASGHLEGHTGPERSQARTRVSSASHKRCAHPHPPTHPLKPRRLRRCVRRAARQHPPHPLTKRRGVRGPSPRHGLGEAADSGSGAQSPGRGFFRRPYCGYRRSKMAMETEPQTSCAPDPETLPTSWRHTWLRPHRAPATCGMTGAPPRWDRHQLGVRQLHPPACRDPRPSGVARPQLYRLSR